MKFKISFTIFVGGKSLPTNKCSMNKSEINNPFIKALIVFRENEDTENLFVPLLCDAIKTAGVDVRCSMNEFWNSETHYNIIHFQWPEEVMGWNCNDPDKLRGLEERIRFFRINGARFVYTRHNIRPHYANEVISRAYEIIEKESDIVVHMGRYSLNEFADKHPGSRNVIIPHHIYQFTYDEDIDWEYARNYLHLPMKGLIVTAFGKFRNREERRMVTTAFRKWDVRSKFLLAPRLYPFSKTNMYGGNFIKRWVSRAGYYWLMPLLNSLNNRQAGANDELIDNSELPFYMAASDVIFIQRKDILNSGNVPLAFLFKKVVVGPNVGNIGEILNETGNPTFCPDDRDSIVRALHKAHQLAAIGKGKENYSYALEHMSLGKVGQLYVQTYKEVLNGE